MNAADVVGTSREQEVGGPAARVLAVARPGGHEAEVLEYDDGTLVIRLDGHVPVPYQWPAGHMDRCMKTFAGLMRHRATS